MPATCVNTTPAGLAVAVAAATSPKKGHSVDENEDAVAYCVERGRFVVADGATDAAYSGAWARQLVERFLTGGFPSGPAAPDDSAWRDWLAPMRRAWNERIDWERLPWYGEEKARLGAFASFLGLEIEPPAPGETETSWRCEAVGDSCLFHLREGEPLAVFPIARACDFDHRPILLASNAVYHRDAGEAVLRRTGACRIGDRFLLATDALAHWLQAAWEAGAGRFDAMGAVVPEDFDEAVRGWRDADGLRNDDTTMLRVEVTPAPATA